MSESNFKVEASTSVLGNSAPNNEVTFTITPQKWMSLSGNGKLTVEMPSWFDIGLGRQNMMFATDAINTCRSASMRIKSSTPDLTSKKLTIIYD